MNSWEMAVACLFKDQAKAKVKAKRKFDLSLSLGLSLNLNSKNTFPALIACPLNMISII